MPPVYSFALKLDGTDVTTAYGFLVVELRNWWNPPTLSFDEVQLPDGDGVAVTRSTPLYTPLDIVPAGNLSLATTSAFEASLNALKAALAVAKLIEMVGGNDSTKARTGVYVGPMNVKPYPSMAQAAIDFTIRCRNPLLHDVSATTAISGGAAATDHAIALGTAHSRPTTTHHSPTSPLTVTYKNSAGATIGIPLVLTFTGSPSTIVIDHSARTITAGGTRHDEYLTAGNFITLDPIDGVPATPAWPTVRVSTGTVDIVHTKQYL